MSRTYKSLAKLKATAILMMAPTMTTKNVPLAYRKAAGLDTFCAGKCATEVAPLSFPITFIFPSS